MDIIEISFSQHNTWKTCPSLGYGLSMKKICKVEDCFRPHNDHGYCSMHSRRLKKRGTLEKYVKNRKCELLGCESIHWAKGYCSLHYRRFLSTGDPGELGTKFHRKRRSGVYSTWCSMKGRCFYRNHKSYKRYGGRGITICVGFQEFKTFYLIMGDRPKNKTLDRINPDGHYSCGHCEECIKNNWKLNCRWASSSTQAHNKSFYGENKFLPGTRKLKSGKFEARIMENGERKSLGSYCSPEEAHKIYLLAKEKLK